MYIEDFSAEMLIAVNPCSVVTDPNCVDVTAFDDCFRQAAQEADEAGKPQEALIFRLFGSLCSLHFKPEDRQEPFSNMIGFADGRRSLTGSDFSSEQIEALAEATWAIKLLPLRVRIADLVWSRDKSKVDHAQAAIDGYMSLIRNIAEGSGTLRFEQTSLSSVSVQEFITRAIVIARTIGWNRAENDTLRATFLRVLDEAISAGDMSVVRFGNLALDYRIEEVQDRLSVLGNLAQKHCDAGDYWTAIELQKLFIRVRRIKTKGQTEFGHYLDLAKIHEAQADASPSAFLKTSALQLAIDSLHGVKGVREERGRLHEKLREAQLHITDELGVISHSTDLTDAVNEVLAGYDGLSLLDCLKQLALNDPPDDPKEAEDTARRDAQRYPLSSLFAANIMDAKGRTIARTEGGIESASALRYQVIRNEGIHLNIAVQASINPARQKITEKFYVNETLISCLCQISPFVPHGWESQVAQGIQAFLYGNDTVAVAILIPFLETGLRQLVSFAGRVDTTISTGGIEQTIGIGALLSDHRDVLERVVGERHVYAIENLFVHELGPKVRHNFCHGLTSDGRFYSPPYIYACKLVFSLVLLPMLDDDNWKAVKSEIERLLGPG